MRILGREHYRKDKISQVRKEAVGKRRDKQGGAVAESVPVAREDDVEEEDETGSVASTAQEVHPQTVKGTQSECFKLLPLNSEIQYEVLNNLVNQFDDKQFKVESAKVDAAGFRMTVYRYRVKM